MFKIPNPMPVQVQPTTEDNQRHAKEENYHGRQTELASSLNWITGIAAVITLVGVIASLAIGIFNISSSRKALETDQRAWVMTEPSVTEKNSGGTYFKVPFRNTGHTPALHTHAWINSTGDYSRIPERDPVGNSENVPNFVVGPNDTGNTSTFDNPLSDSDVQKIAAGARLYIYGTIAYDDVFGKSHWTQFCVYPGTDLKGFGPCAKHNTTDDEHKK